jgi:hypothetical protein
MGSHKPNKDFLLFGAANPKSKPVNQSTKEGVFIKKFGKLKNSVIFVLTKTEIL